MVKLPNFTKLYYRERTVKRRKIYEFLYWKKIVSGLVKKLYPKEAKSRENLKKFL